MDSSGSSFSYTRSIPRQVVESRVESVQWQEDGRVHWWRRHIIISLKRGSQLTTHEKDKRSIRLINCAASIDYCRRPSAIVCDMEMPSLNYLSRLSRCVVDCVVHICNLK